MIGKMLLYAISRGSVPAEMREEYSVPLCKGSVRRAMFYEPLYKD